MMRNTKVKINQSNLEKFVRDIAADLPGSAVQSEADERARQIVRDVRDEMSGQPADEVLVVLTQRVSAIAKPNLATLQDFADAIAEQRLFEHASTRRLSENVRLTSPLEPRD